MDSGTFNSVPHCEFVSAWQNTPFKAAFPLARALIAVSYGKHAAKGSHVVMAKKHLKLEMCQEMKHYEALPAPVGVTPGAGELRRSKSRKLTAALGNTSSFFWVLVRGIRCESSLCESRSTSLGGSHPLHQGLKALITAQFNEM